MKRFDFTVPLGLAIGIIAVLLAAWLEGIRLAFLWQPVAALVVAGGTLGAIIIRRGVASVTSAWISCTGLLRRENADEHAAIHARLNWLARTWRREGGVRALETHAANSTDKLIARALLLAAEYADAATMRRALEPILANEDEAGTRDAATLEAAGGYAPTFGILGAVLGLISVLRSLAEPASLGSGIATAFVATIYGVGIANLVLFPLAARLRERHHANMKHRESIAEALVNFAAQETATSVKFSSRR